MFNSAVSLCIGESIRSCTNPYLQIAHIVSHSFLMRAAVHRLPEVIFDLYWIWVDCAYSHCVEVNPWRNSRHPMAFCWSIAVWRYGRAYFVCGIGILLRHECNPSIIAWASSGAASLRNSHYWRVSIASFQEFRAPMAGHRRTCSVVSDGCLHPGHLADLACFLWKRAAFVPQNPLFHLTTSFFFLGVRSEKVEPRLYQLIVFVNSLGIFIFFCQ